MTILDNHGIALTHRRRKNQHHGWLLLLETVEDTVVGGHISPPHTPPSASPPPVLHASLATNPGTRIFLQLLRLVAATAIPG